MGIAGYSISTPTLFHFKLKWTPVLNHFGLFVLCLSFGITSGCADRNPERVLVLAASSMSNALQEIETEFNSTNPDIDLEFVFAGSQLLAMQINQGAPAQIFVSADFDQIQRVQGFSIPTVLVENRLIALVDLGSQATTISEAIDQSSRIIVAHKDVPAGRYTLEALKEIDCLDAAESKIVSFEHSVRSVLSKIVSGEADLGFVYWTDAVSVQAKVRVIEFPAQVSITTETWIAQRTESINTESTASIVYRFIVDSPISQRVFTQNGFVIPEETP